MAVEKVSIDGKTYVTLKELLRPGLRAVFIGINPAPVSVEKGHYYQGNLGKRLWQRLQEYGFATALPAGTEDEVAFAQGFGFADVVRRPSRSSEDLSQQEILNGMPTLVERLVGLGEPRPAIVFVFKKAADAAEGRLRDTGFKTFRLPGPYARKEDVKKKMLSLRAELI